MTFANLFRKASRRTCLPLRLARRRPRLGLEALEDRTNPSTINWVNDGLASDNFAAVFGGGAAAARAVVRAAIDDWEEVFTNFNNGNGNTIDLTLRLANPQDVTDFGFGGSTNTNGGQAPPSEIDVDASGKPVSGLVLLGRGGNGAGSGYFVDPTPGEHAEYQGAITNAFVASSTAGGLGSDLYKLVLHEVGHVLGFSNTPGSRWADAIDGQTVNGVTITNTGQDDANWPGTGAELWVFDGPNVTYLLTDLDGNSKGSPAHTAVSNPANVLLYDGAVVRAADDVMGYLSSNVRALVSNANARMLADLYGYTLAAGGPERFATFYALPTDDGDLIVRGDESTSNDQIDVLGGGATIFVGVDPGVSQAGVEPFLGGSQFVTWVPAAGLQDVIVRAGAGNDDVSLTGVFGAAIDVTAHGDAGTDDISASGLGDNHAMTLYGDDGNDTIVGGPGHDYLYGGAGDDALYGGAGHDEIYAGTGDDTARGDSGDDYILGDLGNDRLEGNVGADTVYGNQGADFVIGGTLVANANQYVEDGADVLSGNEDNDLVTGDNTFGTMPTGFGGGDDLIRGGDGYDTIYGGIGNDTIYGDAGNDVLAGLWGDDTIWGGDGHDDLYGYTGDDYLNGEAGNDHLDGGDGEDTLYGGLGADVAHGGAAYDFMVGGTVLSDDLDASGDQLYGDDGDDIIYGDNFSFVPNNVGGGDIIDGGTGNDTVIAQAGADGVTGGSGNDDLNGGSENDSLDGGSGDDELDGSDGDDSILGGAGIDTADGGAGNDILVGGDGNDVLAGGTGRDLLIGGLGRDFLAGGADDDLLIGGRTSYDGNGTALRAIRAEWASARPYANRVQNIRGAANQTFAMRLNGNYFLTNATVFDDFQSDTLNGEAGTDWFFVAPLDATDQAPGEMVN